MIESDDAVEGDAVEMDAEVLREDTVATAISFRLIPGVRPLRPKEESLKPGVSPAEPLKRPLK